MPHPRDLQREHLAFARFRRKRRVRQPTLQAILCFVFAPFAIAAVADSRTRAFDVPAGDAARTLLTFVAQAAEQVAFPPDTVRGVKTNTVKGKFTPHEALSRMTTGTSLVVVVDEKSGALAVRRNSGPNDQRAAQMASSARPANAIIYGRVQNVVTGEYLNNARIIVRGTDLVAFTDQAGMYRIVSVPAGPNVIEAFYTDLDVQAISLEVSEGESFEQNIRLTSVARYGADPAVVTLNPFLVSSDKETNAQAIATNEQRFAPNIKNVMATDSLGDVLGSSVGEFLKFMPGVTTQQLDLDITGVSIRGIGGEMTAVTVDGAPTSSVGNNASRSIDLTSMALNDTSRMEVTKVPTPSSPADAIGGTVNMVRKSAFERSKTVFNYGVTVLGNSENITLKKTPHSYKDRQTRKLRPGFNFDFTWVINKNFGIVVTGMSNNSFNEQHIAQTIWSSAGAGTGASFDQPFLQSYLISDGPRSLTRNTLSIKVDWRVTRHSVLSVGLNLNRADTEIGNNQLTFATGINGTPTPASGVGLSYGPDFTAGATGRGSLALDGINQRIDRYSDTQSLNYRFDDGRWKLLAGISRSASTTKRRYDDVGNFFRINSVNRAPVRVGLLDFNSDRLPTTVEVFDSANQPVDYYSIDSFRGTTATSGQTENHGEFKSGSLSIERSVDVFPFPASVEVGGARRVETQDLRPQNSAWTFRGPSGNGLDSLAPYQTQVYRNVDSHYGFQNVPWLSPTRAWNAAQENPSLFTQTPAQIVAAENSRMTNSEFIKETVSALYFQGKATLFASRLNILGGVRYEKTVDEGVGSLFEPNNVFRRNPDGSFVRDAAGNRVRKPEAGIPGSIEDLRITRQERAAEANRTYDGYYPSLHLTFNLKENVLIRAAYAKTYGRPDFSDIIPRTVINEADLVEDVINRPDAIKGTLTVRNSALEPWTADNYDLSLEYYTQSGGLLSAGVFVKEIDDFFGAEVRLATLADLNAAGLDPRYVGWNLSTMFNAGNARISGAEFNVRQSLRSLGTWGSYFTVFANATKLKLEGHQQASFTSFIPESGNWGVSFGRKRITATARWNYRGLDRRIAQLAYGPDGYEYYKQRIKLDLNMAYKLTPRVSVAANINNVLNTPHTVLRYGSSTPDYARQFRYSNYGVEFAVGIKGSF